MIMPQRTIEVLAICTNKVPMSMLEIDAVQPILNALRSASGVVSGYFGLQMKLQVNDSDDLILVQDWENEKHNELQDDAIAWQKIRKPIEVVLSQYNTYHVSFDEDPDPGLSGSCTEIAKMTAKEGMSREKTLLPGVADLVEAINDAVSGTRGAVRRSFPESTEETYGWY
ncbi:hypothetical protein EUX98_g3239 [Antrodiella citrinella]|uniref:ABM domain-containing protein n=1 Tax=Antrodiella citrinella TaxID=2447956 RepID=A0A4S4N552_9APHY|nr:hypothetical protein EUX98_g3239 [Antrodiella citrinella]